MRIYRLKVDTFFKPKGTLFIQHPNQCNCYYPESAYDVEAEQNTGIPHITDIHGFTAADIMDNPNIFEPVYSTKKLVL